MRPSIRIAIAFLIPCLTAAVPLLAFRAHPAPPSRVLDVPIKARQYSYEPHRIIVNSGDILRFTFSSPDAVHGFFFDGHDAEAMVYPGKQGFLTRHPSEGGEYEQVEELTIRTGRPGKYRFRCSVTCGTFHPFMLGEVVVRPNLPYMAALGAVPGILASAFFLIFTSGGSPFLVRRPRRMDLLARFRFLDRIVRKRWFQFALTFPMLAVFLFLIIAGLFGSPIGNRNIIIIIVWIVWWFFLITLMVPLGGRFWCLACPFPFFGEWIQRRKLIGGPDSPSTASNPHPGGLKRKWPAALTNGWAGNIIFLAMCTFSAILLTRPQATAAVMGALVLAATLVHFIFPARTFCMYLCPLGGWMSLYSMSGSLAVRTRDPHACDYCGTHSCRTGTMNAWICPWFQEPDRLSRNNFCGLCMECIKACEKGNLTLVARPFFSDINVRHRAEAWSAFIMITLVAVYSATFLGPWRTLKDWANFTETGQWQGFLIYSAAIWALSLAVVPAIWWAGAWLSGRISRTGVKTHTIFVKSSYMLVPLGLLAWMAFAVPLVLLDVTYIAGSLSDPLGWGWNLFGTAQLEWKPFIPEHIPLIQILMMLAGLALSLDRGYAVAKGTSPSQSTQSIARGMLPQAVLCCAATVVMLRIIAG
ncbi:MAG: 4Fe-4S binding protein [Deltaproteobacteria bacterium]|nr:4Fe-4S binding protein [Deltaproteobacteria bacterium]